MRWRKAPAGEWALDEGLLYNLDAYLGTTVRRLIPIPQGLEEGDRVLYRLTEGRTASRQPPEPQAFDEFKAMFEEVAAKSGGYASGVLPRSEHSPLPATLDILGDVCFDVPIAAYAEGDALLPFTDWAVEWLLGVMFTSEEFHLYYLDFLDPKVKIFVSHTFYEETLFREEQRERAKQVVATLRSAVAWRRHQARRRDIEWARLVTLESKGIVTVLAGELTHSELEH